MSISPLGGARPWVIRAFIAIRALICPICQESEDSLIHKPSRTGRVSNRGWAGQDHARSEPSIMGTIYSGKNRFDREIVGRVAEDGTAYSGRGLFSMEVVGRVSEDGTIYQGR